MARAQPEKCHVPSKETTLQPGPEDARLQAHAHYPEEGTGSAARPESCIFELAASKGLNMISCILICLNFCLCIEAVKAGMQSLYPLKDAASQLQTRLRI